MRVAAAILLFAVLCLTGSSLAWLRATGAAPTIPEGAGPEEMLASFERTAKPEGEIDLAKRYAGRLDLIDPLGDADDRLLDLGDLITHTAGGVE